MIQIPIYGSNMDFQMTRTKRKLSTMFENEYIKTIFLYLNFILDFLIHIYLILSISYKSISYHETIVACVLVFPL